MRLETLLDLRNPLLWICLAGVLAPAGILVAQPCNDPDCTRDCELDDRFCDGTGQGVTFSIDRAWVLCADPPVGGNPGNIQPAVRRYYQYCTPECSGDKPTPGTPNGEEYDPFNVNIFTVCVPDDDPTSP